MKRKDTKCYRDLVENYCSSRLEFESAEDMLSDTKEAIEKSQKRYAEIGNDDSMIKVWFDAFVYMNKVKIEASMLKKEHYEGIMKECGKLLVSDYGEDLEKLYEGYKVN
jgi:hypothetical protein